MKKIIIMEEINMDKEIFLIKETNFDRDKNRLEDAIHIEIIGYVDTIDEVQSKLKELNNCENYQGWDDNVYPIYKYEKIIKL